VYLNRIQAAERMYRISGADIYRECVQSLRHNIIPRAFLCISEILFFFSLYILSRSSSFSTRAFCSSVVANQLSPGIVPRAPIARSLLNAGVVGQDSILNAFYNGAGRVLLYVCVLRSQFFGTG